MSKTILRGPQIPDNVKSGIGEYFWKIAENYGDRVFEIHYETGKAQTFGQAKLRAMRIAINLKKIGIQPNDMVLVICENDLDTMIPALASLFLGAQVATSLPFADVSVMRHIIKSVKPKAVFVPEGLVKVCEEAAEFMEQKPQFYVMGESAVFPSMYEIEKTETAEDQTFAPVQVNINDTAFISFSSGTASLPKGVCLSHLSVLAGPCRTNGDLQIQLDKPIIQFVPMFWISSLWLVSFALIYAMPRIVGPEMSAGKFFELVEQYKIDHAFVTYMFFVDIANFDEQSLDSVDVSSIKLISTGGSYVDPKYILKLRKKFPGVIVHQSYAATEMGCVPIYFDLKDVEAYNNKANSVGKVNINVEIKVADVKTGEPLGPNQEGELRIKSHYRMNGYISAEKDSVNVYDAEGFYKSGDLAYYDDQGYFYITDRLHEVIRYRGLKISPTTLEDRLRKHPAVKEAVVFAVYNEIDLFHPGACVSINHQVTAEELSDYVVKHLGDICRLRAGVKFLDEIPKTGNGKVSRKEVKKIFLEDKLSSSI